MKVNGSNRIEYVNQAYKKNIEKANNSEKQSDVKSQVTIELSETSRELKKQIAKLGTEETIDKQKVDSIKQAIQDGSYKVSPSKLAEKMFDRIIEQSNPGEK